MLSELDQFYEDQEEPNKSCYLALRQLILKLDPEITPEWKYKLPFFYYKGKMFCYFWKNKESNQPYVCIVRAESLNHPALVQEKRKKMKAFYVNPEEDIDWETLKSILIEAMQLY